MVTEGVASPDPVFILGIMRRSGTNYLRALLCLHPLCVPCAIGEDFLPTFGDLLVGYVDTVYANWHPRWIAAAEPPEVLLERLGAAALSMLRPQDDEKHEAGRRARGGASDVPSGSERLVTKTPSVRNLKHFFSLFPHADLLVIVRDGRAVVESGMRSLGWGFDGAVSEWAEAGVGILEFERLNSSNGHRYMIVRYEDLFRNASEVLGKVLDFLGLDRAQYDFERARDLPVAGSSELVRRPGDRLHWEPVARTPGFDPTTRWHHWGRARHQRFNWLAGVVANQLGYDLMHVPSTRVGKVWWLAWNTILDAASILKRIAKKAGGRARLSQ